MAVLGGNPAKEIRKRQCVHSDLVVESLLGGDYYVYKQTRKIPFLKIVKNLSKHSKKAYNSKYTFAANKIKSIYYTT